MNHLRIMKMKLLKMKSCGRGACVGLIIAFPKYEHSCMKLEIALPQLPLE